MYHIHRWWVKESKAKSMCVFSYGSKIHVLIFYSLCLLAYCSDWCKIMIIMENTYIDRMLDDWTGHLPLNHHLHSSFFLLLLILPPCSRLHLLIHMYGIAKLSFSPFVSCLFVVVVFLPPWLDHQYSYTTSSQSHVYLSPLFCLFVQFSK